MKILPRDKQIAVSEGMSIRSVERLTGIHCDTIMRLGTRVGRDCAALHDTMVRDLPVSLIELDELWSYVGKKQRRVLSTDSREAGDQYVFIALDAMNKANISYQVGKRNAENTDAFARDLRARVTGKPRSAVTRGRLTFPAIERACGGKNGADYGQIIKSYEGEPSKDAARRYSPAWVVDAEKRIMSGNPHKRLICTSHVERNNLNVRMDCRRFTRPTNGYSKKLANHEAAISLFITVYNSCRVHSAIRETPAMAIRLTDHPWSIAELMDVAASVEPQEPVRQQFLVIEGGPRP